MATIEEFGTTNDGQKVQKVLLTNSGGLKVAIITYGAAIQSLYVPDKKGDMADIVLGFDTVAEYESNAPYLGVIVGRVAGRVSKGMICLPGNQQCMLTKNQGDFCLHGGAKGLSRQVWEIVSSSSDTVTLQLISPEGDEGFPGQMTVRITYKLTPDNCLLLDYSATCTALCPINLTNHAYFNLAGEGSPDVYDHEVTVVSTKTVELDKTLVPTGVIVPVDPARLITTPIVLSREKVMSVGFDPPGFDIYYIYDSPDISLPLATVRHLSTGRVIEMFTDQPGVQFYTGNFLDGLGGKAGHSYPRHSAVCLEAQSWPDAANHDAFPDINLKPGQEYRQTTKYKLSVV